MGNKTLSRAVFLACGFLGAWLFFTYLLPLFLPFILGLLLALAAEPAVQFGVRCKLPRWASAGVGVSLTLVLLVGLAGMLGAGIVKELGVLANRLPNLQDTATETVDRLRFFAEDITARAPAGIQPLLDKSVNSLFSSGEAFVEQATVGIPSAVTGFLSRVPDGALGIGTGIISGFMLSARLPVLRQKLSEKIPENIKNSVIPMVKHGKNAIFGWLKAQVKLSAITYCVVLVGLLLLKIPLAPLWAVGVAAVDAVPLLGTGTVLLPWALVCLVQRQHFRAIGLLCTYGVALLTRTVLEPRLVGRNLGLDPLVTLVFLYLGYRFWGIWGMLLAPMLVAAITAAASASHAQETRHCEEP